MYGNMKNDKIKELLNKLKELDIGLYEKYNKIYLNQNQPKLIEKWSVGSYVVFLNSEIQSNGFNKGDIQQIHEYNSLSITYYSGAGNIVSDKGISKQIKWFATKSEAEEFSILIVELEDFIEKTCIV